MPRIPSVILRLALSAVAFSAVAAPAQTLHTVASDTVVLTLPLAPGEAPLNVTLAQLMTIFKEPGFSVAVINHNRVAWAKGFGVTAPGGSTPVTPHTLFQAASISKPVTAAGALWLVQNGKLSLDENVNAKLKSWQVPDNEFTTSEKVTLRRILSHNAGLSVHGFAGYAVDTPLPTTQQTLDGLPPANNPPVRVIVTPGTKCMYSGGGTTIAGLLMRDVSGLSFETFMRDHVLVPAGMTDSTFDQPLPASLAAHAATATHQDGKALPGNWHVYPELAPDGLWTTPTDLAKFAIEIALSKKGAANHILSKSTVDEMLTVQCHDNPGGIGGTGLGFGLGFQSDANIFKHNGGNDGFMSLLLMDSVAGWGYSAMGNSDNFDHINGAVLDTLSRLNGWNISSRTRDLGGDLTIINSLRGFQPAWDAYQRAKTADFAGYRHDSQTLNLFGYDLIADKKLAEATKIFQLNIAEYPQESNAYDSLGEAYLDAGNRDLAIKNYEKSLELDPKNANAVSQLKKLRSQKQ
jgi:CubicO group peptidase (beta-lactamase class C family)